MGEEEADQIRRRIKEATPAQRRLIAHELGRLEARLSLSRAVLDEKLWLTAEEAARGAFDGLATRISELACIGLVDGDLDAYRDGFRETVVSSGHGIKAPPRLAPEISESESKYQVK